MNKEEKVFPQYQDYCIGNLPQTVFALLNLPYSQPIIPLSSFPQKKYRHIIVVLIDALGFSSFKKHRRQFRFLTSQGMVTPITSLFPSTTAAVITTLKTGLLPKKHGLFEWTLYLPQIGQTIKTLPFTYEKSHQSDKLLEDGYSPALLLNKPTIFQELAKEDIPSFCFTHRSYAQSAYNRVSQKGTVSIPFIDLADLFSYLTSFSVKITKKYRRTYTFVYIDYIDTIAHTYGPESDPYRAELYQILTMMKNFFIQKIPPLKDTLLVVTSDHGQIKTSSKETIYLSSYPGLKAYLKKNPQGKPILDTGGSRDVFLHIKKGKTSKAVKFLKNKMGEKVEVIPTAQALKKGLFGPSQIHSSPRFRRRLGEILLLPKENYTIKYSPQDNTHPKKGVHGGLSPEEMWVPFISRNLF